MNEYAQVLSPLLIERTLFFEQERLSPLNACQLTKGLKDYKIIIMIKKWNEGENMTSKLERALAKLKSTGVRMTPQRHAILSYLLSTDAHPTVDEIYRALEEQFPNMSVATVYNNLKVFLDSGLVRELTYGDGASRFDADMSEHYHAICEQCGKIVDFEYHSLDDIENVAEQQTSFKVKRHRMEVYGLCDECANSPVNS